jgi:hypothetical protein
MVEGFPCGAENLYFHSLATTPAVTGGCALCLGHTTESTTGLLVVCASGVHPVPSRTRSLSLTAPMVLGGSLPGRVGRRQEICFSFNAHSHEWALGFKAPTGTPYSLTFHFRALYWATFWPGQLNSQGHFCLWAASPRSTAGPRFTPHPH